MQNFRKILKAWKKRIVKAFTFEKGRKISQNFIILIIAVITIVILSVFVYLNRPTAIDKLNTRYIDTIKDASVVRDNVDTSFKNEEYELADYDFYGEDLQLYHKEYATAADDTLGKNIALKNVETGNEQIFTIQGMLDSGIDVGQLDDGLYEIYIYDNYNKKRVYFEDEIHSEPFYTIRRDGQVKNIQLDADKDFLDQFNVNLNKNYAFLSVISEIPKVKVVDLVIDPSGNTYNESRGYVDTGIEMDGFSEAEESYGLAEMIKADLEKAGLRVNLTRKDDEDDTPSYYGQDSRVGKGYESKAKVFLNLSVLSEDNERFNRPYIMTSPLTNASLANEISFQMSKDGLELSNVTTDSALERGVLFDEIVKDEDGNTTRFSMFPQLRETGGKATFAGTSDISKANSEFADDYGMYGIVFRYCNTMVPDSITYYQDNKEQIAKSIATAILNYYEIGVLIDETAN